MAHLLKKLNVWIVDYDKDRNFSLFNQLPKAEHITMQFKKEHFKTLEKLKHLTSLNLSYCSIKNMELKKITSQYNNRIQHVKRRLSKV